VVDRLPTIKLNPESVPQATQDWFAAHTAGTTYAFSLTVGNVAGNEFTLAAPAVQLNTVPQDEDRGGTMADQLDFICTGAADSEWTLTAV
jgi:hypothetical protein